MRNLISQEVRQNKVIFLYFEVVPVNSLCHSKGHSRCVRGNAGLAGLIGLTSPASLSTHVHRLSRASVLQPLRVAKAARQQVHSRCPVTPVSKFSWFT